MSVVRSIARYGRDVGWCMAERRGETPAESEGGRVIGRGGGGGKARHSFPPLLPPPQESRCQVRVVYRS